MPASIQSPAAGPREWFAPPPSAAPAPPSRVFNVADLFGLLSRSRRLIALTIATTTVLAGVMGVITPKKYKATAEVFVDARGFKVLNSEVSQFNGIDTVNADFETQIRIMTSGHVLRRVVERENLATDPAFISQPGPLSRIRSLLGGSRETISDRIGYSVALLDKMVSARRSERSYVVDLTVTDRDAVRAARIAQAIAEIYIETQATNRRDLTRRLGTEVSARLQDLRERLDASEKRLAAYKRDNNLVYSEGRLIADRDLTSLSEQLNQARGRTARARARLEQIRRLPAGPGESLNLPDALDSPAIVQLRVKLAETTRQLAELRRNLGPRHPEILAAEARSANAREAIGAEISRRRTALRNELEQSVAGERVLERQIAGLKNRSNDTTAALIPLRELERSVEANKKVYEEFLVRARELTEQQGVVASSSTVITNATAPSMPTGLSLPVMIALGFFAGIPLGVGLAFLKDQLSGEARRRQEKLAASAPAVQQQTAHAAQPAAANHPSISAGEIDAYIAAGCLEKPVAPPDALVELVHQIENMLGDSGHEVIAIASASDKTDTSSLALALAACWAWEGYEAAAIDAHPASARLAQKAGIFGKPGLFDRYHRNVLEFVEWKRKGLPHLLGALHPSQRQAISGARRFAAQRLEELSEEIEIIVADAGHEGSNAYAQTILSAATAIIAVSTGGDERLAMPTPGKQVMMIELKGAAPAASKNASPVRILRRGGGRALAPA